MAEELLQSAFSPIYGLPCWSVKHGHGSFLTLEFGEPSLCIREPHKNPSSLPRSIRGALGRRLVYPRGQWHLWIYCCWWQVTVEEEFIGNSASDNTLINSSVDALNGQRLLKLFRGAGPASWSFEFDLGAMLSTRPYNSDDQWYLYEPGGTVITANSSGHLTRSAGNNV